MAKSDYAEKAVLDHFLTNTAATSPTTVYLALYQTDPTDANSGTELTGNGYARQVVTFAAATSGVGSTSNTNTVTFTAAGGNWPTATHFGVLDALTVGNLLYHSNLDTARQANDGDSIVFDPGNVTVTEA